MECALTLMNDEVKWRRGEGWRVGRGAVGHGMAAHRVAPIGGGKQVTGGMAGATGTTIITRGIGAGRGAGAVHVSSRCTLLLWSYRDTHFIR